MVAASRVDKRRKHSLGRQRWCLTRRAHTASLLAGSPLGAPLALADASADPQSCLGSARCSIHRAPRPK